MVNFRVLVGALGVLLALALMQPSRELQPLQAQVQPTPDALAADWELISPNPFVQRLIAHRSGVLYASAQDGFWRSGDDGLTWRVVNSPPQATPGYPTETPYPTPAAIPPTRTPPPDATPAKPTPTLAPVMSSEQVVAPNTVGAVDPVNADVIYAFGVDGLYRSLDAGASWQLLAQHYQFQQMEVSQADRQLAYGAACFSGSGGCMYWRSRDGGVTWDAIGQAGEAYSTCTSRTLVFFPHPSDDQVLFRTANCYQGAVSGDDLKRSQDQGQTWQTAVYFAGAYPERLIGGQRVDPGRFYLSASRRLYGGGSLHLARSDDGGRNWSTVLAMGFTARSFSKPWALAYDTEMPDRLWLGRSEVGGGVLESRNGGLTWTEAGRQDLGGIASLALSGNRRYLFAATDRGVWRLALPAMPSQAPRPPTDMLPPLPKQREFDASPRQFRMPVGARTPISTNLHPLVVDLPQVGSAAIVMVSGAAVPGGVNAIQVRLEYPTERLAVIQPACDGPFRSQGPTPTSRATGPTAVSGGSVIGCDVFKGGTFTDYTTTDDLMTFVVTRIAPGEATIALVGGGESGTHYRRGDEVLDPGTLNSMVVTDGTTGR